jgi:predicted nucleic-acid-binding protein
MKAIVDTNILVRFFAQASEDEEQNRIVNNLFEEADEIIICPYVFCELVWTLETTYKLKRNRIKRQIEILLEVDKVVTQDDEVEAGLAMMALNGDFADGVIEYIGRQTAKSGGVFVSFDNKTVRKLGQRGLPTIIPN